VRGGSNDQGTVWAHGCVRLHCREKLLNFASAASTHPEFARELLRREITALFCDLRGFTGFSESGPKEGRKIQVGASGKERQIACMMPPVITSIKPELRSKGLDRRQCCWHVAYQFCGLSAESPYMPRMKLRRAPRRSINFACAV
jgi:hypothetical protein